MESLQLSSDLRVRIDLELPQARGSVPGPLPPGPAPGGRPGSSRQSAMPSRSAGVAAARAADHQFAGAVANQSGPACLDPRWPGGRPHRLDLTVAARTAPTARLRRAAMARGALPVRGPAAGASEELLRDLCPPSEVSPDHPPDGDTAPARRGEAVDDDGGLVPPGWPGWRRTIRPAQVRGSRSGVRIGIRVVARMSLPAAAGPPPDRSTGPWKASMPSTIRRATIPFGLVTS